MLEPSWSQPHFQSACPSFMSKLKSTSIFLVPFLSKILGKHENHAYLLVLCLRYQLGLVNKPNILYRFENIQKYWYGILQKSNIEISELRYQLRYQFKVVLYYSSEDFIILMIDFQTDPIKHLPIIKETLWNEYVINIGFRFKISYRFWNSNTCQP